jgi:hypothetical protein
LFRREEQAIWETDSGWALSPNYSRQRPLGTGTDVVTTLSIGSAERSFEVMLAPDRFRALQSLINTKATFTDWRRPIPDSRMAFLTEVTPLADVVATDAKERVPEATNGAFSTVVTQRRRRTRLTFLTA